MGRDPDEKARFRGDDPAYRRGWDHIFNNTKCECGAVKHKDYKECDLCLAESKRMEKVLNEDAITN